MKNNNNDKTLNNPSIQAVHLSHWDLVLVMYILLNWIIIGSGNGLAPVWCQAITWANDGLLPLVP